MPPENYPVQASSASDLKADLASEIHQIAGFLEIPLAADALPTIMPAITLEVMCEREGRLNEGMNGWKEGAKTFFFKGANGRVLSAEELALYEEKAAQVLTPDCRAWLEQGRVTLGD